MEIIIYPRHKSKKSSRQKEIKAKILKNGCHKCISHCISKAGYPYATINYKSTRLNRWVYENVKGKIDKNLVVRHTCDNKFCINPDHLILGTQQDNMNDMVSKNRQRKGESVFGSKLLTKDIKKIRELLNRNISSAKIAKMFNVNPSTIIRIKLGQTWKEV